MKKSFYYRWIDRLLVWNPWKVKDLSKTEEETIWFNFVSYGNHTLHEVSEKGIELVEWKIIEVLRALFVPLESSCHTLQSFSSEKWFNESFKFWIIPFTTRRNAISNKQICCRMLKAILIRRETRNIIWHLKKISKLFDFDIEPFVNRFQSKEPKAVY